MEMYTVGIGGLEKATWRRWVLKDEQESVREEGA